MDTSALLYQKRIKNSPKS